MTLKDVKLHLLHCYTKDKNLISKTIISCFAFKQSFNTSFVKKQQNIQTNKSIQYLSLGPCQAITLPLSLELAQRLLDRLQHNHSMGDHLPQAQSSFVQGRSVPSLVARTYIHWALRGESTPTSGENFSLVVGL